jgi:hypothetical protein
LVDEDSPLPEGEPPSPLGIPAHNAVGCATLNGSFRPEADVHLATE